MAPRFELHEGDALDVLRTFESGSAHALVTDPPAGIAFMGATWDDPSKYGFSDGADRVGAPPTVNLGRNATCQTCGGRHRAGPKTKKCTCAVPAFNDRALRLRDRTAFIAKMTPIFEEARRVLKPGAHALVWALPRTSHWTATALEDAGFEIRDCGVHLFGSGFPKSLNVSKAIDKAAGAERKVIGTQRLTGSAAVPISQKGGTFVTGAGTAPAIDVPITQAATEDAKRWAGWGTALKPASEHWILARAPMRGTVAANVVQHGTGALNIDACRMGSDTNRGDRYGGRGPGGGGTLTKGSTFDEPWSVSPGRWPANVTLEHLPECGAEVKIRRGQYLADPGQAFELAKAGSRVVVVEDDSDSPRMVFSPHHDGCAEGCAVAALDAQSGDCPSGVAVLRNGGGGRVFGHGRGYATEDAGYTDSGGASRFYYCAKASTSERTENVDANKHPTVKPVDLMRWLCRLITPKGGLVLDPFAGSGTTGVAALMEGMRFVGIERDPVSAETARRRIANALGPLFATAIDGAAPAGVAHRDIKPDKAIDVEKQADLFAKGAGG